ncbi:MAG: DUF5305 family protein [Halobellus sp.]|uniref:DUF5305 family protein n=1 Tax=Halobellus sp. TaxID=1979212 RepID=UPI0035D521E1
MTSQSQSVLRLKYLLSRYGTLAIVGLLLVSTVAFASAALAYAEPPETQQITEQTDKQSFETTVNTSAAVTENTTLYEPDQTLSNMPVYLLSASPNVTIRAQTAVPDDRAIAVTQQIRIELYATRAEDVFWRETRTLANDSAQVTDGRLETQATINVREIRDGRLNEVQSEVQGVGAVRAEIHVDTVYESDKYQGSLSVTTPMRITDRSYTIDAPRSDERSHTTPVTRTVAVSGAEAAVGASDLSNATAQAGLLPGTGPNAVGSDTALRSGLGILALAAALVLWRVQDRLPDREGIEQAYDKLRYTEWISRGRIPESDTYQRVVIEEFVDLIDIAIDSDKRVIHDRTQDRYGVIDGTTIYQYSDPRDRSEHDEPLSGIAPTAVNEERQDRESASPPDAQVTDGGSDSESTDSSSDSPNAADEDC